VALDMRAQAEHGPDSRVVGLTPSPDLAAAVAAAVEDAGCEVREASLEDALAFVEEIAPEHLQLMGPEAELLASRVRHAGCVFVGQGSATAFGDYVAGSNHVLPTGGAARFASALSVRTFRRVVTEVRVAPSEKLARAGATIARAEGFVGHAESMEARIEDNPADA
jgi:histidinol dehydrogenase